MQKIIERGQPVEGPPGPIIVCTRNDDLQGVLDSTPKDRREGSRTCQAFYFTSPARHQQQIGSLLHGVMQIWSSFRTVCCSRGWTHVGWAATHRLDKYRSTGKSPHAYITNKGCWTRNLLSCMVPSFLGTYGW